MRLKGIVSLIVLGSISAYYIYEPIPEDIDERWKLMLTNSFFRGLSHLVRDSLVWSLWFHDYAELSREKCSLYAKYIYKYVS